MLGEIYKESASVPYGVYAKLLEEIAVMNDELKDLQGRRDALLDLYDLHLKYGYRNKVQDVEMQLRENKRIMERMGIFCNDFDELLGSDEDDTSDTKNYSNSKIKSNIQTPPSYLENRRKSTIDKKQKNNIKVLDDSDEELYQIKNLISSKISDADSSTKSSKVKRRQVVVSI